MRHWCFWCNAMSQIEDMRATITDIKDMCHRILHRLAAVNQRQGIKIALQHDIFWQFARCPGQIGPVINTDGLHAGYLAISDKPFANSFRKSDYRQCYAALSKA